MSDDTTRPPLPDDLYTVGEVAAYCKVTSAAVYKWMKDGELVYVTMGARDRRVTRAAIDAFLGRSPVARRKKRATKTQPSDRKAPGSAAAFAAGGAGGD